MASSSSFSNRYRNVLYTSKMMRSFTLSVLIPYLYNRMNSLVFFERSLEKRIYQTFVVGVTEGRYSDDIGSSQCLWYVGIHKQHAIIKGICVDVVDQGFHEVLQWEVLSDQVRKYVPLLAKFDHLRLLDVASISMHDDVHEEMGSSGGGFPCFFQNDHRVMPVMKIHSYHMLAFFHNLSIIFILKEKVNCRTSKDCICWNVQCRNSKAVIISLLAYAIGNIDKAVL